MVLTIALTGLPSAGKSTIINCLLDARVAQTGACRTTTGVHFYGETPLNESCAFTHADLTSDDGVKFNIIDLPGVNDGEDKQGAFDDLTLEYVKYADVILWVTDSNNAFITKHEHAEFKKIADHLDALSLVNGKGYQLAILLNKCDQKISLEKTLKYHQESWQTMPSYEDVCESLTLSSSFSEIKTSKYVELEDEEDTTVNDIVKNISNTYKNTLMYFNAHGRIAKGSKSAQLLKLVKSHSKENIQFKLQHFVDGLEPAEQNAIFRMTLNTTIIDQCLQGNIQKCKHGKNYLDCDQTFLLCSAHGYCKSATCTKQGVRQWCANGDECNCKHIQHSCQNRYVNGRNIGYCSHNNHIGSCGSCRPSSWMYCHHGLVQKQCPDCLKITQSLTIIDPVNLDKLTDEACIEKLLQFLLITNQEDLDLYTSEQKLKQITYVPSSFNQLSLIVKHEQFPDFVDFDNVQDVNIFRVVNLCGVDNVQSMRLFYKQFKGRPEHEFDIVLAKETIKWSTWSEKYSPSLNYYNRMLHVPKPDLMKIFSKTFMNTIKSNRKLLWDEDDEEIDLVSVLRIIALDKKFYVSCF